MYACNMITYISSVGTLHTLVTLSRLDIWAFEQIEEVIPFGPAHVAGLRRGDVVLRVDGVPCSASDIDQRVCGDGTIGGECVLTVSRKGLMFEARLGRSSAYCVDRAAAVARKVNMRDSAVVF
jgi:C-terminal processing protease CtpA/Prc